MAGRQWSVDLEGVASRASGTRTVASEIEETKTAVIEKRQNEAKLLGR